MHKFTSLWSLFWSLLCSIMMVALSRSWPVDCMNGCKCRSVHILLSLRKLTAVAKASYNIATGTELLQPSFSETEYNVRNNLAIL